MNRFARAHNEQETNSAATQLRDGLANALATYFGRSVHITSLQRRPSSYRTSHTLDEITLCLDDGTSMEIVAKQVASSGLLDCARSVKPLPLLDPLRESQVYRWILEGSELGTAKCYGSIILPGGEEWLLLEKVAGTELYQIGEIETWREAARWLVRLHERPTRNLADDKVSKHLLKYDKNHYHLWIDRARQFEQARGDSTARQRRRGLDRLAQRYSEIVKRLCDLPVTFIHGEFYAANILVRQPRAQGRICPIDWEMAALGPPVMDVAALSAGNWQQNERDEIAAAYFQAVVNAAPLSWMAKLSRSEFQTALDLCRLHLAVQWLGWSPNWHPPREHAYDWHTEALRLAGKLRL